MAKIIYKNYFECFVYQKNDLAAGRDLGLELFRRQIDKSGMKQVKDCEYFLQRKISNRSFSDMNDLPQHRIVNPGE